MKGRIPMVALTQNALDISTPSVKGIAGVYSFPKTSVEVECQHLEQGNISVRDDIECFKN